jgi:ADP-heptose:LPS heptosyltransferase
MRILLVRLRQIGDVVFTTPAVRAIHEHFPDAILSYIVEPSAAPIVVHNPHLQEVIVAPRRPGLRGLIDDLALARRLRASRFDLAIDFHGGPRASLLTWLSGARRRIGYRIAGRSWMYTTRIARPRALRPRHSVENQWDLLAPLGIAPPDRSRFPVEMPADAAVAAAVGDRLARAGVADDDRLIVIHVSAGNPFRRWPATSFVELAVALAAADPRRRVVVCGPSSVTRPDGDRDAGARATERATYACGDFRRGTSARWTARRSIDGDSTPLRCATALCPIVDMRLAGRYARSAPWRGAKWITESVDAGELPYRPCNQQICEPGDFRCLTFIKPAQVLDAAERALSRTQPPLAGSG